MSTQTVLADHKPYPVSLPVQSLIPNVQNLVYPSTLSNVACRESVIFVPFTKNIMEKNLVIFPNSMYPHVEPYTPYFGFGNTDIGSVPTMWPSMSNPLANLVTPQSQFWELHKLGLTNRGEPLDEDDEYSKKKHNSRMPQIIPTKKLYHEQRGQPSPIGDVGGFPTGRWIVPMSNDGGEPFSDGGNKSPRGNGGDPT